MATLTSQVQHLQEENSKLQSKLLEALENLSVSERRGQSTRANQHWKRYFWSCGTCCNHKGAECGLKKEGHQDNATAENKMGGATSRFFSLATRQPSRRRN